MRMLFAAAGCAALCMAAAARAQPSPQILQTVSPKTMSAILHDQKFAIGELNGDAQHPVLSVDWPDKSAGSFEIHFSDCKPGKTLADSECGVIEYATWWTGKETPTLEQVNALNAGAFLGRAFLLPEDGQKLKKGTLIIDFMLPLYGGVTEAHLRDSPGGWDQVLQYYVDGITGKQPAP